MLAPINGEHKGGLRGTRRRLEDDLVLRVTLGTCPRSVKDPRPLNEGTGIADEGGCY